MPEWVKGMRRRRSQIRDTEHGQKGQGERSRINVVQRYGRTRRNKPKKLSRRKNRLVRDRRWRIFLQGNEGQSQRRRIERMKRKGGQAKPGLDGRKISFNSGDSKATKMKKFKKREKNRDSNVRKRNRKSKAKEGRGGLALGPQSRGEVSSGDAMINPVLKSSQLGREI
jgi:superfamily II DNA/RNA helicase